ncbi:MAG: hypothetical protein R3F55_02265 [Alphaproteobacteria bacterium]
MSGTPAAGGAGESARTRTLRYGLWGCSTLIIALVVLVAVVASVAYLEYSEPDSDFPRRLADAVAAAGEGGTVDLAALSDTAWQQVSLLPHGETAPAAIDACLGFAWDKSELVAGHLAGAGSHAFVLAADGEALDYGWHLIAGQPLAFDPWPCALARADARFAVHIDGGVARLSPLQAQPTDANPGSGG